jgi:hypothetical protein
MRTRIAVTSSLTLLLGFAVTSATGNRTAGGLVLTLGGALCAWWMTPLAGSRRTLAALAAVAALFVVSHPLGAVVGAWPAVLFVSVMAGGITYALGAIEDPASAKL